MKQEQLKLLFFSAVSAILQHQKQLEKLKGETFNIFSVLKLERKENRLHSAFLKELLDPNGLHLKGSIFLKLLLQQLQIENHLDIATTSVKTEHCIGEVDNTLNIGGQIDIYLEDKAGNCICLENKIDAIDQDRQIIRYCNYKKETNKVFYLTLQRKEPESYSKANLISEKDFYLLSYQEDIVQWLQACLKEAADSPMLRETIKQYLLLIKKLTSTPDMEHEKQLTDLIIQNLETAAFIKNNFIRAKQTIADAVRKDVMQKLQLLLPEELVINVGNDISKTYAQLWVAFKAVTSPFLYFGIESFNGLGQVGGNLFIGIFNEHAKENSFTRQYKDKPGYWYEREIICFEESKINFDNDDTIVQLHTNSDFRNRLINTIVTTSIEFITKHIVNVKTHLHTNQLA